MQTRDKATCDIKRYELYKYYRDNYKRVVNRKEYSKILEKINKEVVKLVVDGKLIKLPCGFGYLYIKQVIPQFHFEDGTLNIRKSKTSIKWGESNKLSKKLGKYKLILEEDCIYQVKWDKGRGIYNKSFFKMHFTRYFKRENLSKKIRENPNIEYYDL